MIISERTLTKLTFNEFFLLEYCKCPERAYMFSKSSTRLISTKHGEFSYWLKSYYPYKETLKYQILKKVYYRAFKYIKDHKTLDLNNFRKLYMLVMEKEINMNRKRIFQHEVYYQKIKNKLMLEVERHFNCLNEFDIEDNITCFKKFQIDLKEYLLKRKEELKNKYKEHFTKIDFDKINKVFIKMDYIAIQEVGENGFNLILTLPYDIEDKYSQRNCMLGTLIRYAFLFLSETLKKDFVQLIVYYPLSVERKTYDLSTIFGVFQDLTWIKILIAIKEKLTFPTSDNHNCKYCENNLICQQGSSYFKNLNMLVAGKNKEMI